MDAFLSPLNEMDSRFLRTPRPFMVALGSADWRFARVVTVDGEPRTEIRWPVALLTEALGVTPSSTPNSLASLADGEGPRDKVKPELLIRLVRRL